MEPLLGRIYRDFLQGLAEEQAYCDLRALVFWEGATPDYRRLLVQQLYLLRYLPAYLAEYYLTWHDLLRDSSLHDLCVLSIGAGNGVDYTALRLAVRDLRDRRCICYHGVDRVQWLYRDGTNQLPCRYVYSEVGEWTGFRAFDYNVIAFPKSIGELSQAAFRNLMKALARSSFRTQQVRLLASLTSAEADMARLEELAEVLQRAHGFRRQGDSYTPTVLPDLHIAQVSGYDYPDGIRYFLYHLAEHCPGFGTCANDDCGIGRRPRPNTGGMQYQLIQLERV